ncbi:MAG: FtsX-like permease family protein [Thermoguttaceae bacterium]|jgi:putative ABC transport system permease protein
MTTWKLTLQEIRRRPGRAVLTLLSIAIGMAAIVAVSLGTATTRGAYRQMYQTVAGRASLEVTAEGGGSFDEKLVDTLARVPGVQAAVPSIQRFAVLYFKKKKMQLLVMGIDPAKDSAARDYKVEEGEFFNRDGAMLESSFARGVGIALHDEIGLQAWRTRGVKHFPVVGLLASQGVAGFNKGNAVFFPLKTAEQYFTGPGKIDTIDVVLADSADQQAVLDAVTKLLPVGISVRPPAARTQLAEENLVNMETALLFASLLTVVLAVFIICNTFVMNVSERRQQLAVLKAVGATRRQIVRMLLTEGLVMGVLGTALGCLAGVGGGYLLMAMITRFFVASPPPVVFTLRPFLLAAVVGPLAAVGAALLPALWTANISPLEAMRPAVTQGRGGYVSRRLALIGVVVWAVMWCVLVASVRGWLPAKFTVYAGVLMMPMVVFLLPVLIGPLARAAGWVLRPLLGTEGILAQRQIERRPTPSGLTVGVLYIAVVTGVGLGTMIITNINDVQKWCRETLRGDFFIRAMFPDASGRTATVPPEVGEQLHKMQSEGQGITNIDAVHYFTAHVADHAVTVVARDFNDPEGLSINLSEGDAEDVKRRLPDQPGKPGEAVLGTALAQYAGLHVGDQVTIETQRQGKCSLRVAGTAVDYLVGGYIIFMHRSTAERLFGIEGTHAYLVRVKPEVRSDIQSRLAKLCDDNGVMLQSFAQIKGMVDSIMAGVVGGLWGILALSFLVAAFGIANTLTMNVLEQTRELAVLRVVAMTRWQIRKMVLGQAVIIGFVGLTFGIIGGLCTAYVISLSTVPVMGYPLPFVVRPLLLVGCYVLGLICVLAAALAPAERAAHLDLLIALQYE